MEQFLSQIPQAVIEMYNITATENMLSISDKDSYIGIFNNEIEIVEHKNTIEIRDKNYSISLFKEIKLCTTTLMRIFPN